MKKIRPLILMITLVLLVACGEDSTLSTIENEAMSVTIGHPEEWNVQNEVFGIAMTDMEEFNFTNRIQEIQKDIDGTAVVLWREDLTGAMESIESMTDGGVTAFMLPQLAGTFNAKATDPTETTWMGLEALTGKEIVTLNEKEIEVTYIMADDANTEQLYYIIGLDSTHENDEMIQQVIDSTTLK